MNKLDEMIKELAGRIRDEVSEALFDVESDVLPYVSEDTESNAAIQAADIVRMLVEGRFDWEDGYAVVESARPLSPRVRLDITENDYDALRDSLIERMPKCPKDAKIKSLENALNESYRRNQGAWL